MHRVIEMEGSDEPFATDVATESELFGLDSVVPQRPKRRLAQCPYPCEFEQLEPRILLSATDPLADAAVDTDADFCVQETVAETDSEGGLKCTGWGEDDFAYEAFEDDIFAVDGDEDDEVATAEEATTLGVEEGESSEVSGEVRATGSEVVWSEDETISRDPGDPLVAVSAAAELTATLHAANPPPGAVATQIVLDQGDRLKGTGEFPSIVNRSGILAPGNSPGIMNVPTFTQGPEGVLEIEIGGTVLGQFDQFNVAGLAELDGTIELILFGGFVPTAGQSFEILTYGSRAGEFAHWLGTSGVPGNDALAFVPVYNDVAGTLTLTVQSTTTVLPAIGATINSALSTLQGIGSQLDSLDQFAETLPLVGDSLGNIVDLGQGIQVVLVDQLSALLASTPTQAEVTEWIEGWEGTVAGAFDIEVLGVLGNYGGSAYSWEVQLTATQVQLNQVLTDVTGAVLDAAFDSAPDVDVMGTLEFDFEFGYDTEAYVAIEDLTARATIAAIETGGPSFDLTSPGGPLALNVTNWAVNFDASVSAVPDPSILSAGRITATTLGDIGGAIVLADAFNLTDQGTVDASFSLDGVLSGFAFDYSGTHTVRIESDDVFDEASVDLTVTIDGALEVLDQTLSGNFVLRKTATETILEGSNISVDLEIGTQRVLLAENGTGTFLVIDGELAGTASVTITQGPDLPNIDISGTTVALAINTSPGAVTSIGGVATDLPAGNYYKVSGNAVITLGNPDAVLSGYFEFEPVDTDSDPVNGNEEVRITATDLSLQFDDGIATVLDVTNGNGAFVITDDGIAGQATADVALAVPGVDVNGTFEILLNDTLLAQTVEVDGVMIVLAAGPFLRVKAEEAELDVLGLTVSGDFAFEQRVTEPGTGGDTVVTLVASDVQLPLGTLTSDLVTFENGTALFIFTSDGVAGKATGDVSIGVPEVGVTGAFELVINTMEAVVMEDVDLGGGPQSLNVPAGPYVQVNGVGVDLNVGPVTLSGDFSFEQRETIGGTQLVTVVAENVSLDIGSSIISATNGEGIFLFTDAGMAGVGQIDLAVSAFGGGFLETFAWNFNQTGSAIDESVDWEGALKEVDLPSGPYNQFSTGGPVTFAVDIGGQMQSITAALVVTLEEGPPEFVTVGVSAFDTHLVTGALDIHVEDGTGAFAIYDSGIAGQVTAGLATLSGAGAVTLEASNLAVIFNNTGADVGNPDPVVVSISEDAADDVSLQFIGTEYHDFFALSGTALLNAGGVVTLGGDFYIQSSSSVLETFEIGVQDLHFDITAGTFTALAFENGTGAFVIDANGVAGEATVDFEAGIVGLMGTADLKLNTTGTTGAGMVLLPDGSTQSFSGIPANSFSVCLTDARINVGPLSVEIPGGILIEKVGGNVEVSRKSGGALLATISTTGELTINDAAILADLTALAGFGEQNSTSFVGMLRSLLSWMSLFQDSEVFDINIPFTQNTTLGDALAWSDAVFDELYAYVVSIEAQSVIDFDTVGPAAAATVEFDLTVGDYTYAGVSVSLAGVTSLGDNNSLTDPTSLIGVFNNAFALYGAEPVGAGELHEVMVARANSSFGDFRRFALALTEEAIKDYTGFQILDPDSDFSDLGFAEDTDVAAGTVTQNSVSTSRYSNPEFIEALGDRIVTALGGDAAEMPEYDPATLLYAFPVSFDYDPVVPPVAFDFDEELGPIGSAEGSGEITISPTLTLDFTIGFDLTPSEVPRILSSTFIPVPANGQISETANFELLLGGNPDDPGASWIELMLAPDLTNNSIEDLAADFNTLFALTPYGSSNLLDYVYVQKAGSGLAISVLDEDLDNDGVKDTVYEDTNDNSILDGSEDVDGDGNLDVIEQDWNSNGLLDDLTGTINLITVRTLQDDVFATELGFGVEAYFDVTEAMPFFRSVATAPVKGLFIEDAEFEARVDIETTDNITGSVNLGFLEISLDDPGPNGIATINPYTYDIGTNTDIFNPASIVENDLMMKLSLVDANTGESRIYLSELLNGIEEINIPDMIVGPELSGGLFFSITEVSASIGSATLPTGVELFAWIPDITKLNYNSEPYHSVDNPEGIFLTYPDLGAFGNLQDVSFTDVIRALRLISDGLGDLSAFSFLDERLPLIDISINDMLAWAEKIGELFEGLNGAGSQDSIQDLLTELEDQIELLFNLDPEDADVFSITLDTSGIVLSPVAAGGTGVVGAFVDYLPNGDNNDLLFTSSVPGSAFNGSVVRIVGSNTITDSSAIATWDEANKVLTIEINGGVTTATDIITAVAALTGTPWVATLVSGDNGASGNDGTGTYSTSALKFTLQYSTGYANSLPFMLDLQDLVSELGVTNSAVADFLAVATDLISVESSGMLEVSAGATATIAFGLDLTNPGQVKPFLYDETGVELQAKVLGTNITFEAALGGVIGIFVEDGTITLDADGDPATGAGDGDQGATFSLGLRDDNGDGRHFFTENILSFDSIDLSLVGGVSAVLPIFAPTQGTSLGSDADEDNDGFPDNALAIDIPDLQALFGDVRAVSSLATIRMPGANNDFTVAGNSSVPDNFSILLVEGGGTPSFNGEVLTIPVTSGVTTADQIETAVEALGLFIVTDLPGNDGSGPGSSSALAMSAPDFSALFDELDLCELLFSNFGVILEGLDSLLGRIQGGLEDVVSKIDLPLVGSGLMGAANFISDFRGGLLGSLTAAIASAGGNAQTALENAIKEAFWNSIGPGGLDILVDPETGEALDESLGFSQLDVTVDCENGLDVNLRLGKQIALVDTSSNPIDFDIGIPGLGLSVDGNVLVAIGFDLKFHFGYSPEDGFWYDSSATGSDPELRLYFEATIPGLSATGQIAFLQLQVSDSDDDPSFFVGQFLVDIMDPDNDGKLTFSEVTSPGTTFKDIVHADLEAVADISLDLVGSFGGNTAFPSVLATFNLDWSWSVQNGVTPAVVEFTDVFLDVGSFLSEFLAPVLEKIQEVTGPIQPLLDAVTARLPIFSDLAGKKVTMLTLAQAFGLLEPSTVKFIENVAQIITLINDLEGLGEGSLLIPFSAFSMSFDEEGNSDDPNPLGDLSAIDLESAVASASGPDSGSSYQSSASGFASSAKSLDNFSIPLFDNPGQIINLFMGDPVGLVEWRMPTFRFDFEWTQSIPVYPPLYAILGGGAFAEINIGFGYDTFGIQKYIASEERKAIDILDGFHVLDYDENGNERPEVLLGGEIFAGIEINLTVVTVGVRGGVYIEIGFDLHDITPDGKVRPSDIFAAVQISPACLFDIHGEIGLFLEAYLTVDLFFFSFTKEWRFAEIILIEFDITCPEPVLASPESGGMITVHSGPNAGDREEIDTSDGNEIFTVQHISGDAILEVIEVIWGNYRQQFTVDNGTVVLMGGSGDDYFDVRGVLSKVDIDGGIGNDTIFLSDVAGSVAKGGDGNDVITVTPHDDAGVTPGVELHGGSGNDLLTAGTAAIIIYGDDGADLIIGSSEKDFLYGGGGADDIQAGAGDDVIEGGAGNDVIEAYTGNDIVYAGEGNDVVRGSRGDDQLFGEGGDDELLGSSGNDLLVGGPGADFMNGHGGIDLLIGDDGELTGGEVAVLLAAMPVDGITVENLSGDGNDIMIGGGNVDALFGVGGNDYLYGGNLFNTGETTVIEEDHNDFFDGGPGNDTIFGDDAMGRTGDRDTGIAIRSAIWFDNDLDGTINNDESGFAGVTVILTKAGFLTPVATTETDSVGAFDFTGLDPADYQLHFSVPAGLSFTTENVNGDAPKDSALDSDVNAIGVSDSFSLTFDETISAIGAGYTGAPLIVVSDVTVEEGNSGMTQAVFSVEFSGPAGALTEVAYQIVDLSALTSTGDYEVIDGASGTLIFEAFDTDQSVVVNVVGDQQYEGHEQFQLIVTNPFGGLDVTANATILNDDAVPTVSIRDSIPPAGATEADDVVFVVELSNPSDQQITVNYRTDGAYDYNALPVGNAATLFDEFPALTDIQLVFEPGDVRKEVVIPVSLVPDAGDVLDEPNEVFYVDLYDAENAIVDDYRGVGILVDDDAPVSVFITPTADMVPEGDSGLTPVTFTLHLSAVSGKAVTITYATSPGEARETDWFLGATPLGDSPWHDYEGLPVPGVDPDTASNAELAVAIIEPGDISATFTVDIRGDYDVEPDEFFFVNILSTTNADIANNPLAETNHATVLIQNDDALGDVVTGDSDIRFSSTMYMIDEPDAGSDFATITLERSTSIGEGIAVLSILQNTATAGVDYTASSPIFRQLVIFAPGELTKTVDIEVLSDAMVEGNETILLNLKRPTGQPMPTSPYNESELLIKDPLEVEIIGPPLPQPPEGTDAGGPPYATHSMTFTVGLKDGAVAQPGGVTVDFETLSITANGGTSALEGTDFIHSSGTLTILAGTTFATMTISVKVVEDEKSELAETFAVRLSNVSGAELAPEDSTSIATIYDDDQVTVSGTVFYDKNGNGFQDFDEDGLESMTVEVSYEVSGVTMTNFELTDANGLYTSDIFLGPVTVTVLGDTLLSPYQTLDPTSPYFYPLLLAPLGEFETTTFNEVQATDLEMVITGPETFAPVGYQNGTSESFPEESDDVGRGGTDDMIFGGPGNDIIDAGAGDDHVVGGHWMTATDFNVPVNSGLYDATITVTDQNTVLPYFEQVLHPIYGNGDATSGPIFSVDLSALDLSGVIEGEIWIDANGDGFQGAEPLQLDPVLVNLLDAAGNVVNSLVTNTGEYKFDNIYVEAAASTYVVEFLLPQGFEFSGFTGPASATNNDVFLGGRTEKFTISSGVSTVSDIDAGMLSSDFLPDVVPGGYEFSRSTYSIDQEAGTLDILVLRGDSTALEAITYTLDDGSALGGINYLDASGIIVFQPGETFQVVTVEVFDSGLGFCDFLDFTMTLREPTGRPLAEVSIYLFGGVDPITDDDVIDGGDDWDIILGDSGVIPGYAVIHNYDARLLAEKLGDLQSFGGPGKDVINGGGGPDFIDGQLEDDIIAGDEGNDHIEGGMGNDIVIVELDFDDISDIYGRDRIISDRDVATTELTRDSGAGPDTLVHIDSNDITISTFQLFDDIFGDPSFEIAQITGGYQDNTFNLTAWTGSVYLNGHYGDDTLIVENDIAQMLLSDSNLPLPQSTYFQSAYGYLKNASVSLSTGETYHLGSLENVTLIGGASDNIIDASAYSRSVVTFEGGGGDDTLVGGALGDVFVFTADTPLGTDTVTGNGGQDLLDFSGTILAVDVDLAVLAPATHVVNANLSLSMGDLIENLTGGMDDDILSGNSLDNVLLGGPGNDTLEGRGGNETYSFTSDAPNEMETIIEAVGGGVDTLDFSGMPVPVSINLAITGNQLVTGNLTLQVNDGFGGEGEIESIFGTVFDDTIRGNGFDNALFGLAGEDVLDGKSGDDLLVGGLGNDDLDGGAGVNDRFGAIGNTDFTLADSALTRSDGEVDTLDDFELAWLFGGSGPNRFDVSGWTQDGVIDGLDGSILQIDTVIAALDADFTLSDGTLVIQPVAGGMSTWSLTGIEVGELTGGESANAIDTSAFTGATILRGGLGGDTITAGSGPDFIDGGPGADVLTGGLGNDLIRGGDGSDTLIEDFSIAGEALRIEVQPNALGVVHLGPMTPANAVLNVSKFLDSIESVQVKGSPQEDFFDVSGWSAGTLSIDGGLGNDQVIASGDRSYDPAIPGSENDVITLTDTSVTFAGSGAIALNSIEVARIQGGDGDDFLDASAFTLGTTLLEGQAGNDTLQGGTADDFLFGGEGDDTFLLAENGTMDLDVVVGGLGVDTIDFSAFNMSVTVDLGDATVQTVAIELDLQIPLLDVENAIGGNMADTIQGNGEANTITGGPGADALDGFAGNNTILEEADADMTLTDGSLDIGGTVDALANFGNAELIGGASANVIDASGFTGTATIHDGAGSDTVTGSMGGTTFVAGADDDLFIGMGGDDVYLFDGDLVLGSDTIDDAVGGVDRLDFSLTETMGVTAELGGTGLLQTVVPGNLELTLLAGTLVENLTGGDMADMLTGDGFDNVIRGGLGDDLIDGAGGLDRVGATRDADMTLTDGTLAIVDYDPMTPDEVDTLIDVETAALLGGDGANTIDASAFTLGDVIINGGNGNDLLIGSLSNDIILGGAGHDVIRGLSGDDDLFGGLGNDDLTGGEGNDDLVGGLGSDIYRFNQVFDVGIDTIFEPTGWGAYDQIFGLGLAGIDIDLHEVALQTIGNVQITLIGATSEIEAAF